MSLYVSTISGSSLDTGETVESMMMTNRGSVSFWTYIEQYGTLANITMFCGINPNGAGQGDFDVLSCWTVGSGSLTVRVSNNSNTLHDAVSNVGVPLNKWTHMAYSCDGSKIILWMNSERIASASFSGNFKTTTVGNTFGLGNRGTYTNENWGLKGNLQDFTIWNAPLDDQEVQKIYNGTPPIEIKKNFVQFASSLRSDGALLSGGKLTVTGSKFSYSQRNRPNSNSNTATSSKIKFIKLRVPPVLNPRIRAAKFPRPIIRPKLHTTRFEDYEINTNSPLSRNLMLCMVPSDDMKSMFDISRPWLSKVDFGQRFNSRKEGSQRSEVTLPTLDYAIYNQTLMLFGQLPAWEFSDNQYHAFLGAADSSGQISMGKYGDDGNELSILEGGQVWRKSGYRPTSTDLGIIGSYAVTLPDYGGRFYVHGNYVGYNGSVNIDSNSDTYRFNSTTSLNNGGTFYNVSAIMIWSRELSAEEIRLVHTDRFLLFKEKSRRKFYSFGGFAMNSSQTLFINWLD